MPTSTCWRGAAGGGGGAVGGGEGAAGGGGCRRRGGLQEEGKGLQEEGEGLQEWGLQEGGCGTLQHSVRLPAGISHVLTVDLHHKELHGLFDMPVDNLRASPIVINYIKHEVRAAEGAVKEEEVIGEPNLSLL